MSIMIEGPIEMLRTKQGWVGRLGPATVFFGDKTATPEVAQKVVPDVKLNSLRQIHSDRIQLVTQPTANALEGDAQISREKNIALAIQTADCLPVMITDGKWIAAVHAGWRGLEADILQKTVLKMRDLGAIPGNLKAVIGPHIGRKSFEVGRDVSERLLNVYRKLRFNPSPLGQPHADEAKRYVDMAVLAQAQLIQAGVPELSVSTMRADTFTDAQFHSFRRDKEKAGRMTSFIVLTK